MLYSPPGMVSNVMVVDVADSIVGGAGANCTALAIVPVAGEVMLPLQFAADTSTDIVSPMSPAWMV